MIEVRNVCKTFDEIKAIDRATTKIMEGQIFGLVGSNGAGKSTFLRMLSGVLKADEGEILIDGKDVYENIEVKANICFLSDVAYFPANATGKIMRDYYAMFYKNFDSSQFDNLAEKFQLDIHRKISTFSKGMQKQLSMILGVLLLRII